MSIKPIPTGTRRGYANIHYAARIRIGRECAKCGATGRIEAALQPNVDRSRLRTDPDSGLEYSVNAADYQAMCVPCHRHMDLVEGRSHCKNGHEFTPENTSVKSDGSRRCAACHRDQERARNSNPENRARRSEYSRKYRQSNPLTAEQKARKLELQRVRRATAKQAGVLP